MAYVAIAQRVDGGDEVALRSLYLLEGASLGGEATTAAPPANGPGKAALFLDLSGESAQPLAESLRSHLAALLPAVADAEPVSVDDVIATLQGQNQVAYVVLTERAEATGLAEGRVFVVPDVLRISIQDDVAATAAASKPAPEVEWVPDPAGGPPLLKFEFDPAQYDVSKQQ